MTPYWFLNVSLFNLLNAAVGAAIGLYFANWKWILGLPVLLGVGINFLFDLISYGNPFEHPQTMVLETIGYLSWTIIFYFVKKIVVKTQERAGALD
jgi:hypothetical protein